jgi:23S rRNA pseudouridine2605 synthase
VTLDGYTIRPPKIVSVKVDGENAMLRITIHEGRNRQIRRMCQIAGMHVTRLRRIREGSLVLGDLPKGKWRYLTLDELEKLK